MNATATPAHALNAALDYAERGWPVFPCHSITPSGHCDCRRGPACDRPGKHPRLNNGRTGATTDPDKIERWWDLWPTANVAIATGQESGIVVIDLDSPEAHAYARQQGAPPTFEQRTGSGGTHLIYLRPEGDEKYSSRTKVAGVPGLDSRADGGYIIAPPSRHISGGMYEWIGGAHPAPAPAWWREMIRAPAPGEGAVEAPEWNPDGSLPHTVREMLEHIPADEYTVWRDVGMAIHYTDPGPDGFAFFDWWSGTSRKYDAESVRREWRNWSRRGHAVANPVTMATVRRLAESLGWTDPDVEHGATVAAALTESAQKRIAEQLQKGGKPHAAPEPPESLIPEYGLIGDIARWIEATAIRPQPRLAFAAAAAFVGALAGRRYASPTNLRTNLYLVGLAPTGAGKNHARSAIQRLATAAGLDDFLGADHIASGSAIVNSLAKQPVKLYMLDEFGLLLQSLTGLQAAGHKRELVTRLLELYSLAQSAYRGVEYADPEARPRVVIQNPHVCIYGTSTATSFWAAVAGEHVLDGTLNRMLVVDTGDYVPPRLRSAAIADPAPPDALIAGVRELVTAQPDNPNGRSNLGALGGGTVGVKAHVVPMTPEVADAEYEFACEMDKAGGSEAARAIYSRVSENAIKLALLHAVSLDPGAPWVGPMSWTWGRDVALWCANVLMHEAAKHMASTDTELHLKTVHAVLRATGERGLTRTELFRATRALSRRDRQDAIETLTDMGAVSTMIRKPEEGAGRPATVFVCLDPHLFDI